MAKDPAFLFYPGDWQGGTATFSRFLKGCYMDILIAQFNSGPLSLEEIKTVLGSDFGTSWPTLQKKFRSENSLFFNERLETEKIKRKDYSKSRSDNRNGKSTYDATYVKHMSTHMENENENRNLIDLGKGGLGGKPKNETGAILPFKSVEFKVAWYGWKKHLEDKKSPYQTFSAEQGGLSLLVDIAGTDEKKAVHTLDYCRKQNWKSLIADKNYGKTNTHIGKSTGNSGAAQDFSVKF